ncbi:MAG: RRXRR domain-containing protein, partial [Cyanobacteriota bacterium]|nr:RRXRR domain-containing protein [Cyanobacteriota bacterium]
MNKRVPVVDQNGTPLMPTKASRARRMISEGKAIGKWSDLNVFYIQLTGEPSGYETQEVVVGNDPGKSYSGVGVQTQNETLFQAHLILPFGRVRARMDQRRLLRRSRR